MDTRLIGLITVFSLAGCFADPNSDFMDTGTSTQTTGDGDGDGDPTQGDGDGDPTQGDGDGDPAEGGDDPPSIESFEIDGSGSPPKVLQSKVIELVAHASDDLGVAQVEFFEDGDSVGLGAVDPLDATRFVAQRVLSGEGVDGVHQYTVIVTDTTANTAEAGPIQLEVDVPAAGTVIWEHTIEQSPLSDDLFDCMVTADGVLVVGGAIGSQGAVGYVNAVTGNQQDVRLIGVPNIEQWRVFRIEPGPANQGVVAGLQQSAPGRFVSVTRHNAADNLVWDTGPLRESQDMFAPLIGAMATTGDVIYVSVDRYMLPAELIILDMQDGDELCAASPPGVTNIDAMFVLTGGDVISLGRQNGQPWVARYTNTCEEVWSLTTDAGQYTSGWMTESGTVLAAGWATVPDPAGPMDGILREFNENGDLGASTLFDRANGRDLWNGVAQTPTGKIVLAGESGDTDSQTQAGFYVRAEQPAGTLAWEHGPVHGSSNNRDRAAAVCLDLAGNTFVVGNLSQNVSNQDWHIVRFAP
ncbi:Ig-like domain-containing protein [Enhygromyxa salina]|uniref:Uncharacterized protein n=1 Tax=Enhygromyxa salina TaxID=215803 RepID=A0A2S9YC27_9BACT|nr:Ig-like domain-containing protein [Enhygromyxa salina]PRQ02653.1 hypothetical protein ENSA7_54820 [Enhygromyxa salina]